MESPAAAPKGPAANDPAEQVETEETELSGSGADSSVEAVFELLDLDGDGTVTLDRCLFDRSHANPDTAMGGGTQRNG